tara:strand:- start:698 stop:1393 length:696 start_codon:yes stop_codon:yes gene_type:complete
MSDILTPLPPVDMSFLAGLAKSRAVMEAAEVKATENAMAKGSGMKNTPLAPRGSTPAMAAPTSKPRTKFDALPDQDVEYLSALPANMTEQVQMGTPIRDVHAAPISNSIIESSGMPDSVKKAMMAYPINTNPPIPPAALTNVNMDLMNSAVKDSQSTRQPVQQQPVRQQVKQPQPQRLVEQATAPMQGLDANMVKQLVREELTNLMVKNIREEAIKDTIRTLMKEGIIPKK